MAGRFASDGVALGDVLAYSPLPTVVVAGEAHIVRYVNAAFCRLMGGPAISLNERPLLEMLSGNHDGALISLLDRVRATGEAAHTLGLGLSGLGGEDGSAWTIWPIAGDGLQDGLVLQMGTSSLDAATERRTDTTLRDANQQLLLAGLDAQEQADEAQESLAAQRDLERRMEDFLIAVAHDLKTPLTTIKGFGQLLLRRLDRGGPLDSARIRQDLIQINDTVQRMVVHIDVLLARRENLLGGSLTRVSPPVDMGDLVALIVSRYQLPGEMWHISLRDDLRGLRGTWDASELERLVWNLLSNAVKYSPDGGEIEVHLRRQDGIEGLRAMISVRDQGIGIPASDLPYIFARDFRAGNVGEIAGSGIGLAGVMEIVERYRGAVWAEPRHDRGTTFTVRLPVEAPFDR